MADEKSVKNKKMTAVGRRKEAVARIKLVEGKNQSTVNGKPINEYFLGEVAQRAYLRPFEVAGVVNEYSVWAKIVGGGEKGQLDAFVHGVAGVLAGVDPKFRTALKQEGLLTRDARVKERRKYGLAQKARAKKQSPKR